MRKKNSPVYFAEKIKKQSTGWPGKKINQQVGKDLIYIKIRFATICEQDGLHAQIQSIILSQTGFKAKHIFW